MDCVPDAGPRIGIALSGGGARAIAYHLGCLRTLHRLGILQRARVMSTVSGGSVIGAMYAVHDGTFDEFEHRVRTLLRTGLFRPAIRTALTSGEGLKALLAASLSSCAAVWLAPVRFACAVAAWFGTGHGEVGVQPERWAPRRFASRTTLLRRCLDDILFKGRTLGELRSVRPKLVIVAAELRTGSAFYFSNGEAGSWRFGRLDPSGIRVAQAVAASAAYPLLLPALDERYTFRRRDRSLVADRVTLSDGGVYDNLGL